VRCEMEESFPNGESISTEDEGSPRQIDRSASS